MHFVVFDENISVFNNVFTVSDNPVSVERSDYEKRVAAYIDAFAVDDLRRHLIEKGIRDFPKSVGMSIRIYAVGDGRQRRIFYNFFGVKFYHFPFFTFFVFL